MSDLEVGFAEIDGQHVELLPARTLLQVFSDPITPSADVHAPTNVSVPVNSSVTP